MDEARGGAEAVSPAAGGSVARSSTHSDAAPSGATATRPSIMDRLLAPRLRGVPLVPLALLGFAAWVTLGNYLPTRAVTLAAEDAIANQQAQNLAWEQQIRDDEAAAKRLETDRWANERILRNELHMSRKGEVPVR
ncbi:MAG: hypothetical protein HMLKMBBP_00626 [Planctomycetes bacterium]|nr:hypothetical protein [Planctomycetota bacterium]